MRELIALRAKIDLMKIDDAEFILREYGEHYLNGFNAALNEVEYMIDKMVGDRLEEMYAEHIQEASGQTD